jgi:hypothetical protein
MFLFIIESDPKNIEASFNPAIKEAEKRWSERDGEKREILGVNIKEKDVDKMFFLYRWPLVGSWLQRERAYMQLISRLLNLEFEQLWSYQKIRLAERIIAWIVGIILVLSALSYTWYANQTVDITTSLKEISVRNNNLPPLKDAIVTLVYDNKTEVDTIHSMDTCAIFTKIHRRYLNTEVRMKVTCRDFVDVDTTFKLSKDVALNIQRDSSVYGNVHFRLWNPDMGKPVANAEIEIAGHTTTSDEDGRVKLFVPLEFQEKKYFIKSSIPLENDTVYLPCGPDDVVLTK